MIDEAITELNVGTAAVEHAKWMCKAKMDNQYAPIECLKAGPEFRGSLVIVDDCVAIVGLVTKTSRGYEVSLVIQIEEEAGKAIKPLQVLFSRIRDSAKRVESI